MATPAMAGGMYEGSMKDAPAPMPPVSTWTGFYIGGGVGAGAVVHELDVDAYHNRYDATHDCVKPYIDHLEIVEEYENGSYPVKQLNHALGCVEAREWAGAGNLNFDGIGGEGVFGTVQAGYDWHVKPRVVFGLFGDLDFSAISTEFDFSADIDGYNLLSGSGELDMNWMWTLGARLGYLATPDTLVYLLAGYTQADFDDPTFSASRNPEVAARYSNGMDNVFAAGSVGGEGSSFSDPSVDLDTFSGFTVGIGMETRLDHNWGLKLEYRFTQLQAEEVFSWSDGWYEEGYVNEVGVSADLEPSIHTGRVALTYRFNHAPAPMEDSYK
jgi:opacity protein-like surface antigen